ncbi:uncharacterized protein LOC130897022 [Diorhabda carinulata]|uniref:uncharacterized protein LOC130897022 n=1 Tax=Diorhabda carinulata TaxID=1163345 RepID=UPI0025A1CA88|nr:uncharacterized protein LOC130897022 [Diorhabda carinulata]
MKTEHLDNSIESIQKEANRKKFSLSIISLPDLVPWNVFILITTILNYILVTINISFYEDEDLNFLPFYLIFDTIYLANCIMLIAHRILKIPHVTYTKTIVPIIAIDMLSILLQVSLLLPFIDSNYRYLVPLIRISTFSRLRHLDIFNKVAKRIIDHRTVWFIIQYIVYFGLIMHSIICMWYLTDYEGNYALKPLNLYLYYVYSSIQILLNIGYGDVFPMKFEHLHVFFIMFIIGQILIIWLITNVAWLIINNNFYQFDTFRSIENVKKYVNDSDEITKWITVRYYTLKQCKFLENITLLKCLPPTLSQDIDYDLNCGLLHRSLLLNNLPEYVLRKISSAMKTIILPAGESVYYQFVVKSCMVCIENGILKVLSNEDEESPIVYFRKGTILGETALFLNIPSKATVTAAENTELRVLEKQDFMNVMSHFPYYLKQLQTNIKLRLIAINQRGKNSKNRISSLKKIKDQLYDYSNNENFGCFHELYKLHSPIYRNVISDETVLWLKIWRLFNSMVQVTFCSVYPYYAVFEQNVPYSISTFGICADIACLIDVMINCKFYTNIDEGENNSLLLILDKQLDNWKFNFDIFSLFPMEIWSNVFSNQVKADRFYDLLKFNRLLRLHRLSDINEILFGHVHSSLAKKAVNTLLYMIGASYYSCCILYISSCIYVTCDDNGWYILNSTESYPDIQDPRRALILSFYFAISTVFYTGIGDFLPKAPSDFIFITIIVVIFLFLKCYWLGQLIALGFLNTVCNGYIETKWFLKNFSDFYHIRSNTKKKIISYLKINPWFYREKTKKYIQESAINSLDTLIQISGVSALHDSSFFKNMDSYFLALIEKEVKCWLLPNNEILYPYGDPTRTMFIIQEGFCKMYDSNHTLECTVGPGKHLGLLETIYCLPKKHTVIASTDCKLICIEYAILDRILRIFPKELYFLEKTKYDNQILERVEKLELIEVEPQVIEETEVEEDGFFNITKIWPDYFEVYRSKLGPFWFLSFIFLPATINPEGLFIKVWCVLRAVLISLQTVVLILVISLPPFAYEINWIEFASQLSLYLDMYLSLHMGYYDGNGMLKVHPAYTAWHYLSNAFLLDLIAAIPWQIIMFHIYPDHYENNHIDNIFPHYSYCSWNLVKLIQFYKVLKCLNYFQNRNFMSITAVKIFKFLFCSIIVTLLLSSVGISYICQYKLDQNISNTIFVNEDGVPITGVIHCQSGFLKEAWMNDTFPDVNEIYTTGIYFITNLVTSTAIGDIIATTNFMKIGTSFIIIIGFFLFTMITVVICVVVMTEAEETLNFRENVNNLSRFLDKNNIHFALKTQVMNQFDLIWNRSKGFNINAHENVYNEAYFRDVLLMQRNRVLQNSIPIFPNLGENYLKIIFGHFKVIFIQKGDSIIRYKDIISDIFIIVSGQVDIFDKNYEHIETLGSAGVFGNIRKSIYSLSTVHVEAKRNVELWIFNTEKFLHTVKYYPIIRQDLETYFNNVPSYLAPTPSRQFEFFSAAKEDIDELESDEESSMRRPSSMFLSKYTAFQLLIPTKWMKFTIQTDHKIFKVTDFLTFIASLINIYIIPYIFTTQYNGVLGYIYLGLEPIFIFRIFLKLHKAHINYYGNLISTNSKIWQKYLNKPMDMFWDIIPNLPVELIWFTFPIEDRLFYFSCFRLFHLLRFYYITKYLNSHLKKFRRKTCWYLINLLIHYSILVHYLACIWFMLACPFNKCSNNSWLKHFNRENFEQYSNYKLLLSYYYVLNILTTTGIGDVSPVTYWEMVFTLITLLIGKIVLALAIGTVLKMIYISERSLLTFNTKYNLLKTFLKDKDVSDYPLKKTCLYLKNLWSYSEGYIEWKILENLSFPLQQDLTGALYGRQLRETFLFKDVDQSLLLQICTKLKRTIYFKDDYIVKTGEVNSTMYFIYKGDVSVISKHTDHLETKHVELHTKDIFGVSQGLNLEEYHNFSYRTVTPVAEVLTLKYDDWSYLLQFFPREKKQIFNRVNKEYKFK